MIQSKKYNLSVEEQSQLNIYLERITKNEHHQLRVYPWNQKGDDQHWEKIQGAFGQAMKDLGYDLNSTFFDEGPSEYCYYEYSAVKSTASNQDETCADWYVKEITQSQDKSLRIFFYAKELNVMGWSPRIKELFDKKLKDMGYQIRPEYDSGPKPKNVVYKIHKK